MTGKQKDWLAISVSIFTLTVILDALVIPTYGLLGAAIVSCAMMLLMGTIVTIRLHHNLYFWLFDHSHLKIWMAWVLSGIVTILIVQQFNIILPLHRLITTFLLSLFLFSLFLWKLGINSEDKALVARIFNRK